MTPSTPRREPQRTCVGCRQRRPKARLVRLALVDGGRRVTIDVIGRLPGRGAYLCRDSPLECLERAMRRRLVLRSLGAGHDVIEGSALGEQLRRLIEENPP
ncbi:MAG: YlxR family protein [Candidatus Dormibacteraeota bacterium]|nr:YlxR family protein [Candidatus Dormibacteraeota bacterium]MBV9524530.1 YlxR family protein [Candidatus Dormibacteraeota bacterium]